MLRDGDAKGTIRARCIWCVSRERSARPRAPGIRRPPTLAPLVRITRSLDLQREWTMTTTVDRVSSFSGAIALDVPLLAGENVVDNLATDSLHVKAVLPAGVDEIGWSSSLPIGSRLFLRAESTSLWTETWTLKASPRWHVAPSGLPRIQAGELTWMPVVGETLSVVVEVPKPVAGPLLTIESARLDVSNGRDLSEVGLVAQVLAGIGGELFVGLPDSARVRSVKLDGEERNPLRGSDGRYRIEVSPGEHEVEVHWIQGGIGSVFRKAPRVDLSASGTNASVVLSEPASGWIVAMGGPGAGPAVLWWGVFAAMVVFALGLSRIPGQPLGFWSWLLLFAGTSTVNHLTMLPFAAWVVAMVLRSKAKPEAWSRQVFRLVQIGCVLLAAIAWGWILATIPQGLLGRPDMLIEAPGWEHAWFLDRIDGTLPRPWEVVLPLWLWRSLLLAWSLWLAFSCVKWRSGVGTPSLLADSGLNARRKLSRRPMETRTTRSRAVDASRSEVRAASRPSSSFPRHLLQGTGAKDRSCGATRLQGTARWMACGDRPPNQPGTHAVPSRRRESGGASEMAIAVASRLRLAIRTCARVVSVVPGAILRVPPWLRRARDCLPETIAENESRTAKPGPGLPISILTETVKESSDAAVSIPPGVKVHERRASRSARIPQAESDRKDRAAVAERTLCRMCQIFQVMPVFRSLRRSPGPRWTRASAIWPSMSSW